MKAYRAGPGTEWASNARLLQYEMQIIAGLHHFLPPDWAHWVWGNCSPKEKQEPGSLLLGGQWTTLKRREDAANPSSASLLAKQQAQLACSETDRPVCRPGFPAEPITFLVTSSLITSLVWPQSSASQESRITYSDVGSAERLNAHFNGIIFLSVLLCEVFWFVGRTTQSKRF